MSNFEHAFKLIVGEEGGFTKDPRDPGNWTGGKRGMGVLKGTKYGVSAASYPKLDIVNLTLLAARTIYMNNYWNKIRGDDLPWIIALPLFDAAINEGPTQAVKQLQHALDVEEDARDGSFGPLTMQLVKRAIINKTTDEVMHRFMAYQLEFKQNLKGWAVYGKGWERRIIRITQWASQ